MIGRMSRNINGCINCFLYIELIDQLVPLPQTPNVVDILKAYSAAEKASHPKRAGSAEADIFEEVVSGINIYFDRCLGNILLYRFERQQYIDIRRSNERKQMSEIYGAGHLLRLFGIPPHRHILDS